MDWDRINLLIELFNKQTIGLMFYGSSKNDLSENHLLQRVGMKMTIDYDKLQQIYDNSAYVALIMYDSWLDDDDIKIWLKQ